MDSSDESEAECDEEDDFTLSEDSDDEPSLINVETTVDVPVVEGNGSCHTEPMPAVFSFTPDTPGWAFDVLVDRFALGNKFVVCLKKTRSSQKIQSQTSALVRKSPKIPPWSK